MVCSWQEKFHGDENESLLCTTLDCVYLNFFCVKQMKFLHSFSKLD
jgi:hypothetical protein